MESSIVRHAIVLIIVPALAAAEPTAVRVTRPFAAGAAEPERDPLRFVLGPEVVADRARGVVRLARSVLVVDEMGATDFNNAAPLSATTWARKTLDLDRRETDAAELFLYGEAAR